MFPRDHFYRTIRRSNSRVTDLLSENGFHASLPYDTEKVQTSTN